MGRDINRFGWKSKPIYKRFGFPSKCTARLRSIFTVFVISNKEGSYVRININNVSVQTPYPIISDAAGCLKIIARSIVPQNIQARSSRLSFISFACSVYLEHLKKPKGSTLANSFVLRCSHYRSISIRFHGLFSVSLDGRLQKNAQTRRAILKFTYVFDVHSVHLPIYRRVYLYRQWSEKGLRVSIGLQNKRLALKLRNPHRLARGKVVQLWSIALPIQPQLACPSVTLCIQDPP